MARARRPGGESQLGCEMGRPLPQRHHRPAAPSRSFSVCVTGDRLCVPRRLPAPDAGGELASGPSPRGRGRVHCGLELRAHGRCSADPRRGSAGRPSDRAVRGPAPPSASSARRLRLRPRGGAWLGSQPGSATASPARSASPGSAVTDGSRVVPAMAVLSASLRTGLCRLWLLPRTPPPAVTGQLPRAPTGCDLGSAPRHLCCLGRGRHSRNPQVSSGGEAGSVARG